VVLPLPPQWPTHVELHLRPAAVVAEGVAAEALLTAEGSAAFEFAKMGWRVTSVTSAKARALGEELRDYGGDISWRYWTSIELGSPEVRLGLTADGPFTCPARDLVLSNCRLVAGGKTYKAAFALLRQPDGKERRKPAEGTIWFAVGALPASPTLMIGGYLMHLQPDENAEVVLREFPMPTRGPGGPR